MINTKTNVLVLENSITYREVVQNLLCSIAEDDEQWIFSDGEKILKKSSVVDVIDSIFSLDLDNRKTQKAVIDNLYDLAVGEEHYENTLKLMNEIEAYIYELEWGIDYDVKVSYEDFHNIIKAGVEGILLPENLFEKFHEYIKIAARLLKVKILVMIGMQQYFTQDEWHQIEITASYENIYLLCIENRNFDDEGNKILFDFDDCRVI